MKKKENLFNFDSIPLSKTKESYLNINYQNPLPNLQPAKNNIIQNFQVQQVQKVQQPQTNQAKGKNTFFNQYASSSVYLPSRKYEQKEKSYLKEYRLGLLSAGSTSYNNVIIPMISLTRQPSGFFNENEKSFGNDNLKRSRNIFLRNLWLFFLQIDRSCRMRLLCSFLILRLLYFLFAFTSSNEHINRISAPVVLMSPESKLKFCKGSMSRIASIKKPSCEYAKQRQNEI